MTIDEARQIVGDYGEELSKLGKLKGDVMKLPNSPAMVRYAIFMVTEAMMDDGILTEDMYNSFTNAYACIDTMFIEDPDVVNDLIANYGKDEKKTEALRERGGLTAFLPSLEKMVEYQNFVAELDGNWGKSA